ncbi:primosomal protein N' [Capilliphycus salinus ALCB114379]|uniref:primosomal protein N' n=1 Tax=Capilliphycus salinus TaxID=2768948 RepID=UPI0039A45EAF
MFTITFDQSPLKVAEAGASYNTNSSSDNSFKEIRLIEVLVDIPAGQFKSQDRDEPQLFTYSIPTHINVEPGDILSVPFGAMYLGAIAIRPTTQIPPGLTLEQIKPVDEVVSKGLFPPYYWQLLQQIATYYQTPLIQVIRTALPPGLLRRSQRRVRLCVDKIPPSGVENFLHPPALKILQLLQANKSKDMSWAELKKKVGGDYWTRKGYQDLLDRGWAESYLDTPKTVQAKQQLAVILIADPHSAVDVTKRQQEVLQILKSCGGEAWLSEFLRLCKTSSSTVKTLAQKGYVLLEEREMLRLAQGIEQTPDRPKTLTPHQTNALNIINQLSGFAEILLHGVTGSGKTEVYLQAIAPILEQGKSALVLVPEIGLTPQLTDRFRARFGEKVCVYHSGLSEGERYDTWRNMTRQQPQIIIGTRSAIFAPLSPLGLIILDEEHDSSFKQDRPAPCYHARNVALWRAQMENCPLILGSATPSLESWVAVRGQQGRGTPKHQNIERFDPISPEPNSKSLINDCYYLSLPERIQSRPLPPVEVVDMRQELRQKNRSIFSSRLQRALQQLQERGQQGILFIHRRGHSTFVSCRSCGYVMECPDCDVSLSYHHIVEDALQTSRQVVPTLRCHYCNYGELYPQRCPQCDSPYFKHFGSGTQRVVEELGRLFPELRLIRFDSDTTRTKDAHRILLTRFAQREADLLVGTQMLTKGLDLAGVSLVGVVSADGLLHLSDYRASERAFQTLLQVAGRAGRGQDPGRVIIQTYTPEHPVIQAVQHYQYQPFVERELQERQELNYPPFGQLIALKLSGLNQAEVEQTAEQFAEVLFSIADEIPELEVVGPAPAPILRVANRYRWQILLKLLPGTFIDPTRLEQLQEVCPRSIRLMIDVDPLHLG